MTDTLATRLVTARKSLEMTQDVFCAQTGLPLSTLKKYEGSHSAPGTDALAMIAKVGINVHWLVTGAESMMVAAPAALPVVLVEAPINVDALVAAFVGMATSPTPGQTPEQTARKGIELYLYMVDKGMIRPEGVGSVAPGTKFVTRINVEALCAAYIGMSLGGATDAAEKIATNAIEFYLTMLDRGLITLDGIGDGDLSNAA